mmetsp:Transcript_22677/g.34274  ORF Transcript_22677/g.34274 Transcript_22677/m.34274 type:complete len:87 (-) Transcript_22677:137-397(-)|eukprot:CAMPEP_0178925420 /NCGR_PEP_ID=MMETSP0786-20121207/17902_1 /TAXON_ID=186022 /ORGANISM="Thalassionema frauenfeldii, Strain CCMP 1798" /LENGTH=86 /DNA_ID=CAMNT_0020600299 /DNA_START=132 /DNA_END=392 /DNA_ORIENTATION=+
MKFILFFISFYVVLASAFTANPKINVASHLALHPEQDAAELEKVAIDHFQTSSDTKERKQPKPRNPAVAWCQDIFSAKKKNKQVKN